MPVWKKAGEKIYSMRNNVPQEEYYKAHIITKNVIDALQKVDIESAFLNIRLAVQFINSNQ